MVLHRPWGWRFSLNFLTFLVRKKKLLKSLKKSISQEIQ